MPDWSLSGKVLFAGYPGANGSDLYSIDVESGNSARLTNDDHSQMFATWSPDGSQIAYMHDYFLWMMNADGSSKRPPVDADGYCAGGVAAGGVCAPRHAVALQVCRGAEYAFGRVYLDSDHDGAGDTVEITVHSGTGNVGVDSK